MNKIHLVHRNWCNEVCSSSDVIAAYHNEITANDHAIYLDGLMTAARDAVTQSKLFEYNTLLHSGPYADVDADCVECYHISYSVSSIDIKD